MHEFSLNTCDRYHCRRLNAHVLIWTPERWLKSGNAGPWNVTMQPLTLPSSREQLSLNKPLSASSGYSHEHSPEHFIEVCALVEADTPNNEHFAHRWLKLSWPIEEQEKEDDSAESLIFDVSPETCLV
jgi:hypothetical protein